MAEPLLSATDLTRRFGGLVAVDQVTLELNAGAVHAVIGPNGAGKSTLANLLSGELVPSAGTIRLRGEDTTGWPADRVARHGLARTFQHTHVFAPFTAFEHCRLAAQAHASGFPSCFRAAEHYPAWTATASEALAVTGLAARANVAAAQLSHGERRALDIAMALATRPSVLLLDEPLAGMGPEEAAKIVALLQRLAVDHAILLIEHDMDAVFALAQQLTVMANGRVVASGTPDAIRANAEVQQIYLGTEGIRA